MKNTATQPEFVEFKTKDGLTLPGLFYKAKKGRAAAICLHGCGASVFYNKAKNSILASAWAEKNISTLYFNNRGAQIIKGADHGFKGREKQLAKMVADWLGMVS